MNYKNIKLLVLGAGGNAGIGMTRCLKDHFTVFGVDDNKWAQKLMEVPTFSGIDAPVDLRIPVPTSILRKLAGQPDVFLPTSKEIELCWNKDKCAEVLGDLAPKTFWVRDTTGSGGKGAQMCSEYLPGRNISCEVVYYKGELKGYFQKERISYSVGGIQKMVAGVGTSMVSTCIDEPLITGLCDKALRKTSDMPHGIYGIDFKENEEGILKITEINAGRFLTASYIYFYLTDYNLPKLAVETALGIEPTKMGKYPFGKSIIRQLDKIPWIGEL